MDPVMFYHLGQILHREIVQQAEARRGWQAEDNQTNLWERLRAHISRRQPRARYGAELRPAGETALPYA